MVVGSRSRRARQWMNRQPKQSSSTESSSSDEGEGGEGEEESIAMDTSPSEGDIRIDMISMEELTETIHCVYIYMYMYMCVYVNTCNV